MVTGPVCNSALTPTFNPGSFSPDPTTPSGASNGANKMQGSRRASGKLSTGKRVCAHTRLSDWLAYVPSARNTDFPPTHTPVLRPLHASARSRIHLHPPLHLARHLPRGLALGNRAGNGSQGQESRAVGQAGGHTGCLRANILLQSEC